jgi:hypothetical protein
VIAKIVPKVKGWEEKKMGKQRKAVQEVVLGRDGLPWPKTFDVEVWGWELVKMLSASPSLAADAGGLCGFLGLALMVGYQKGLEESASPPREVSGVVMGGEDEIPVETVAAAPGEGVILAGGVEGEVE